MIETLLRSILAEPGVNRLEPGAEEPAWAEPLVGVAAGDDPLWERLRADIGPFLWTPIDAFRLAYPDSDAAPADLRVAAWVLPQTEATRQDHRQTENLPSRRWSLARHYGEEVNARLRSGLTARLKAAGVAAAASVDLPQWGRRLSERRSIASTWSERHAAFMAGLGTFGLCDGLITPRGKAVRVGSVVLRADLPVTPRPYGEDHRAWCLFFSGKAKGKCRVCAKRCPAGAISEAGHDKERCKDYIRQVAAPFVEREQLGFPVNSCGLCQTGVPCESRVPVR